MSKERFEARELLRTFDPVAHVGERHSWMIVMAPEVPVAGEECIVMFNRQQSDALRCGCLRWGGGWRAGAAQLRCARAPSCGAVAEGRSWVGIAGLVVPETLTEPAAPVVNGPCVVLLRSFPPRTHTHSRPRC